MNSQLSENLVVKFKSEMFEKSSLLCDNLGDNYRMNELATERKLIHDLITIWN